ncbi:hypothetical protein BDZ91DRAFT_712031 [Kalaharituber pfeilii]|nr:hypothetical protein BDZ91DRAFT_712031 [Kalaharituber pfeilii]
MLRAVPITPLTRVMANRVRMAENQAAKVKQRRGEKLRRLDLANSMRAQVEVNRALKARRLKSRADEMEDRWLGPLAPKRVVNEKEKQLHNALSQDEVMPPPVPREQRIKHWNIVPKDRVLILKGADKHKIGKVKSILKESNSLIVEGMNMIDIEIPEYLRDAHKDDPTTKQAYTYQREIPLPYDDVRLVYPLPNPETGVPEDTIIDQLETKGKCFYRDVNVRGWKRIVAGTDIVIPWPKGEPKEEVDQECDTRRLDVEHVSYIPILLQPPFPEKVIDELRNKYSKFRTRHDPAWLAKKLEEEKAALAKKAALRTPIQELNRKVRLEKKALGPPTLSEEMLERIGRVMAMNDPKALEKIRSRRSRAAN